MKKILFLTGTRADFGKLKPLIRGVASDPGLDFLIAATGMHLDDRYGRTEIEITKSGFEKLISFSNSGNDNAMDLTLARTIQGLSPIIADYSPDLLVVHGDRVEALAGAIVGALNNVRVAHIEGGEFSGTVDELMRHSVTKLSHIHYVANESARDVVLQLGEHPNSVWMIGSPEVDLMLGSDLPNLAGVRSYYEIPFDTFALLAFHPVTTELGNLTTQVKALTEAVRRCGDNFVVVYPNNDHGSDIVLTELLTLGTSPNVRLIPSVRFEAFQTLLKHAQFILGNSSSGVREACVHGTPAINIGSRQVGRNPHPLVLDIDATTDAILHAIAQAKQMTRAPSLVFGDGKSAHRFLDSLHSERLWSTPVQKVFHRT
ncbi:MAG: UDP-N-acetylglucosamine 2-epimerase (hydrolyzing) [Ilumatobacteraceae bacterium]|nr:UDP-N-acetylglucosamine 2-epimerase (hydrolyzing) [Ilumatobacteraceae bacterium]